MIIFGPVPSRRLGRSLGINTIPYKVCSYSCVYCQVGRTKRFSVEPRDFDSPGAVFEAVQEKIEQARILGESIDYLSFVPDGEPTLDRGLGRTLELLKPLEIKTAVITNSSLVDREEIRSILRQADWVSCKVDAVFEDLWRRINRPHRSLDFGAVRDGLTALRRGFPGTLVTETMLIRGVNDSAKHLEAVAAFLGELDPDAVYFSIPTRPPAEKKVKAPPENALILACRLAGERVRRVDCLTGYEGNAFSATGNAEEDLLSITSVHPLRQDAVDLLLDHCGADPAIVADLLERGLLRRIEHNGEAYYLRRFRTS